MSTGALAQGGARGADILHSTDRAEQIRLAVVSRQNRVAQVAPMRAHLVGCHAVGLPAAAHLVPDACSLLTRVYLAAPKGSVLARAGLEHLLEHPGHC